MRRCAAQDNIKSTYVLCEIPKTHVLCHTHAEKGHPNRFYPVRRQEIFTQICHKLLKCEGKNVLSIGRDPVTDVDTFESTKYYFHLILRRNVLRDEELIEGVFEDEKCLWCCISTGEDRAMLRDRM